jgi:hypothetical protein
VRTRPVSQTRLVNFEVTYICFEPLFLPAHQTKKKNEHTYYISVFCNPNNNNNNNNNTNIVVLWLFYKKSSHDHFLLRYTINCCTVVSRKERELRKGNEQSRSTSELAIDQWKESSSPSHCRRSHQIRDECLYGTSPSIA